MRRREFLAGLLAASAARAEERARIAILHSGFPNRTPIHLLFEALGQLGYEHGRTAVIDLHGGEGNLDRLSELVTQLSTQKPHVIIAITAPAAVALKRPELSIPVVFAVVLDPVGLGLVESLARPAGNFTGTTYSEADLGGKRLEFLVDALPGTRRVAVLWGSGVQQNAPLLESIRSFASTRSIEVFARELRSLEDLAPAFDAAAQVGAQAVIFLSDNLMFGHRKQVAELALAYRLPSMHAFAAEVQDGGLMFYGPSLAESYRRVAALTDRIIKGARPGELPVEQPTKFELTINLKTAKALGLTLPESFLLRADEVIE
jgi:putative tryptophan/tyrosine transport system substrate-binding protein